MEWEKVLWALGGFAGGLLSQLLRLVVPSYADLAKENQELREDVRSLEDALADQNETKRREP